MKRKEYPSVVFSSDEEADVIYAEFTRGLDVDLSIARQLVDSRLDFTNNQMHYLIADVSKVKGVTAEAKEYLQQPETGLKNILGAAFIASNPVAALIANIFIKTRKQFPAKFFTNRNDAFAWIHEYKSKIEQQVAARRKR